MRLAFDQLSMDLEKLDKRFEAMVIQADVYKSRVSKEYNKQISDLNKQINDYQAEITKLNPINKLAVNDDNVKISATVNIFESILRHMCGDAEDFQTMLYSFIFPSIYTRLMTGTDGAYFLEEMPASAEVIIDRGREYLEFLRSECTEHLTDEEPWQKYHEFVIDWLRNDALPLIYQNRSEDWDTDVPLNREEILDWVNNPSMQAMAMPEVFDAYEIARKRKDDIYTSSGIRAFELQMLQRQERV